MGRAEAASTWYRRAFTSDPGLRTASAVFRAQIAHISATQSRNIELPMDPVSIHELTGGITVQATELQWLREDSLYNVEYGSKLGSFPGPDPTVGVMWWGGRAVTVLDVKQAGLYQISVRARNVAPAPTELSIEHDFASIATMTLAQEDGSSELLTLQHQFEKGLHVLGIGFLNDGAVNGVDRNATVDSIEIVPAAPGSAGAVSGLS
jgi:hypothetical protein